MRKTGWLDETSASFVSCSPDHGDEETIHLNGDCPRATQGGDHVVETRYSPSTFTSPVRCAGSGTSPGSAGSQNNQYEANGNSAPAAAHNAVTGANTLPPEQSAHRGGGVGHTANRVPVGEPGSGPESPEQPIDGRNRAR
jgi:hypothetical protein